MKWKTKWVKERKDRDDHQGGGKRGWGREEVG